MELKLSQSSRETAGSDGDGCVTTAGFDGDGCVTGFRDFTTAGFGFDGDGCVTGLRGGGVRIPAFQRGHGGRSMTIVLQLGFLSSTNFAPGDRIEIAGFD